MLEQYYERYLNLADVAGIAGAVSALAFLVSLVLLNIQVHAMEKNQRAITQQARAGRTVDIAMRIMASDFAEIFCRHKNGDPNITQPMLGQFIGYCHAVFLGAEDSFSKKSHYWLSLLL